MKTSLYRYFSDRDRLLYVGISKNPFTRLAQHGISKDITQVRWIELEWFDSRAEAKLAEKTAVHRERPIWNIAMQIEARKPRTTTLPLAPPDDIVITKPAAPKGARERIGPRLPWYVYGIGDVDPEGLVAVLPPDIAEGLLSLTLRYGDVLVAPEGYDLPDHIRQHCMEGVYVMFDTKPEAVAHVKELSAARSARRSMPAGWEGIEVDAEGKNVRYWEADE